MVALVDLAAVPEVRCRDQYLRTVPWNSVCIHEAQTPERPGAAWAVARYLVDPWGTNPKTGVLEKRTAGIHYNADNREVVRSADPFVMTVPHCYRPSAWSVGIECCTYTEVSGEGWHDAYSQSMLRVVASLCGALLVERKRRWGAGIPAVHLTPLDIVGERPGFFSHLDATMATQTPEAQRLGWGRGDHTDGRWFPWGQFFDLLADDLRIRHGGPGEESEMARRYGFFVPGTSPGQGGVQPVVEIDEGDWQLHGYHGASFIVTGSDVQIGDYAESIGMWTVDLVKLIGAAPRYIVCDAETGDIVAIAQGGNPYRITAAAAPG